MIQCGTERSEVAKVGGDLSQLQWLLHDDQITPLEYAKEALQIHEVGLLYMNRRGRLFITVEWIEVHRDEIGWIENLAWEAMFILEDRGQDYRQGYEQDRKGSPEFWARMDDLYGQHSADFYKGVFRELENTWGRHYNTGSLAQDHTPAVLSPVGNQSAVTVGSEEELNTSLIPMIQAMEKLVADLEGALPL